MVLVGLVGGLVLVVSGGGGDVGDVVSAAPPGPWVVLLDMVKAWRFSRGKSLYGIGMSAPRCVIRHHHPDGLAGEEGERDMRGDLKSNRSCIHHVTDDELGSPGDMVQCRAGRPLTTNL